MDPQHRSPFYQNPLPQDIVKFLKANGFCPLFKRCATGNPHYWPGSWPNDWNDLDEMQKKILRYCSVCGVPEVMCYHAHCSCNSGVCGKRKAYIDAFRERFPSELSFYIKELRNCYDKLCNLSPIDDESIFSEIEKARLLLCDANEFIKRPGKLQRHIDNLDNLENIEKKLRLQLEKIEKILEF